MRRIFVKAYDHTGNRRVDHLLAIGDLVDWKRRGCTGFAYGRVVALQEGKVKIAHLKPHSKEPICNRDSWIKAQAIMTVRHPDGQRKQPYERHLDAEAERP